ncbi:hypothetical protein OAA66_05000 [Planktomarina temperata]|nr:hypothetical protein [Planktomarina temperata]
MEIAAPLKFLCCAREQMLREQKLRLHKSGLSRKTAIHAKRSQRLQFIRHSDILTTSRYIDVNSKKLSEAVELL